VQLVEEDDGLCVAGLEIDFGNLITIDGPQPHDDLSDS
jgi:hypothetical protein